MDIRLAVVPGDGIGPDIVDEAKLVLDKVGEKFGPSLGRKMEVMAARRTNLETAREVFFLHRVAAGIALTKEPLAERLLFRRVDTGLRFGELRHGLWLA